MSNQEIKKDTPPERVVIAVGKTKGTKGLLPSQSPPTIMETPEGKVIFDNRPKQSN